MDREWTEKANSLIRSIGQHNDRRVVAAHHLFKSDGSGGIIFNIAKPRAVGEKVNNQKQERELVSEEHWTAGDIRTLCEAMDETRRRVIELRSRLTPIVADVKVVEEADTATGEDDSPEP